MEIKVLGSGCAKCKTTYEMIEKIVKENQLDATLSKVEDIVELLNYGIMTTPLSSSMEKSNSKVMFPRRVKSKRFSVFNNLLVMNNKKELTILFW